jgi:putative salt-induced outer membrane protein YdiY
MPARPSLRFFLLGILGLHSLLSLASSAQTYIFHLENGDRITGRFVSQDADAVVIATSFAGEIRLDLATIRTREEVEETVAGRQEESPALPQSTEEATPPLVTPAPVPAGSPAVSEDPAMLIPADRPRSAYLKRFVTAWQGEVQVGLNLGFSTTTRQTYSGRFKATHIHAFPDQRVLRNILDYKADFGRTDGTLSENRMDGSWKTEYDLTRRFLFYNSIGAGYDQVRNIDLQYDLGPGAGYKIVMRPNFLIKAELGGNFQKQHLRAEETRSRYSFRLAEDAWWQVTPRFRIDQKIELFPEIENFGEFRLRGEGNLRYLLRDNLTLNLSVINLYDSSPPRNASHNDLQVRSTLGLKF